MNGLYSLVSLSLIFNSSFEGNIKEDLLLD